MEVLVLAYPALCTSLCLSKEDNRMRACGSGNGSIFADSRLLDARTMRFPRNGAIASCFRANPQKPANDMNAPSATSKHAAQVEHLRSAEIRDHRLHFANGTAGKAYVALR
jgi:hypothetical protein